MAMTMTQKILAAHAGLEEVHAGQLIRTRLDLVLGNDITSPVAINEFEKAGFEQVFDKSKIAMVMDHFTPNKDIKAATQCKQAAPLPGGLIWKIILTSETSALNMPYCRSRDWSRRVK